MKRSLRYGALVAIAALLLVALTATVVLTQDQPTILLGSALSLSGSKVREGTLYKQAYDFTVDYINSHGGVKVGDTVYNLAIKYYDDESSPTKSATLVEKLITQDKVNFLLGPYSSGITIPDSAVAEKYKIPMIEGGGASETIFSRGFKYIFGTLAPAGGYFEPVFQLITDPKMAATFKPLPSKVALLYADDKFDTSVAEGTRKLVKDKYTQFKLVVDEKYPSATTDFTTLLTEVKAAAPDIVLLAGHAEESLAFVQQAKELDVNAKMMVLTVGPPTHDFRDALGADANFIYGVPSWAASLNFTDTVLFGTTQNFVQLFEKKYNYEPDYHNASGAADVIVYKEAIEAAGSLDPKAVRDAIAKIDIMTEYGPVKFKENGQIDRGSILIQIQNGKVVVIYPSEEPKPLYPMPTWSER